MRSIFKKRDFYEDLYKAYLDKPTPNATPMKKRDGKLARKINGSDEGSMHEGDWDARNDAYGLEPGQKLIHHKTSNSMNNMLPSVKTAHDEAAIITAEEKLKAADQEKKRVADELERFESNL